MGESRCSSKVCLLKEMPEDWFRRLPEDGLLLTEDWFRRLPEDGLLLTEDWFRRLSEDDLLLSEVLGDLLEFDIG